MASHKHTCAHCGATTMQYKHGMAHGLAAILIKFAEEHMRQKRMHPTGRVGKVEVCKVGLTRNEGGNYSKLRYWNLIEKVGGAEKGGDWCVTEKAFQFLRGEITLPHHAWTYRAEVQRYDGGEIHINDVMLGYKIRPEYAREAIPAIYQSRLF